MIVSPLRQRRIGAFQFRAVALALSATFVVSGCRSQSPKPQLGTGPVVAAPEASTAQPAPPSAPVKTAPRDTAVAIKSAEVEKTVAGVFGDTAQIIAPLIDAIPTSGPTWDIDVRSYEGQERVAHYVNLFTQGSRVRFQEKLRQGTRYESMIRGKLRAGGIPEDMMFLAMVESGYDPNAYSSAAAVGMWQFMSSTARDVGLRVDWWVDERRDPARSTDAAIRFLSDLQNQFGSLYLAAAAYNGGPGRVSRGLTRFAEEMEGSAGEDRFFALAEHDYLRSETKNYVPQIIAAALVGKEPARYGFAYDTLDAYVYDSVEVGAGTPLGAVATASGVELATIKDLNPAVLRGVVPPTGTLWVRIPANDSLPATEVAAALAALPESERVGFRTVKSTGTESAASIASKAGITAKQLSWYNPGLKSTKKGKLVSGQTVRIPSATVVAAASNVPDPSIERYGSKTVAAAKSGSVHIVKRGETLGRIASRYRVTVARLKSLNGLRGDRVVAGQALRVRGTAVVNKSASKSTASKSSASKSTASKASAAKSSKSTASKASTAKSGKPTASKASTGKSASGKSTTAKTGSANSASSKTASGKTASGKTASGKTASGKTATAKAASGKTAAKKSGH